MPFGTWAARRLGAWLPATVALLFPPDPGLVRLREAARATLAATLTLLLTRLLGHIIPVPFGAGVFGFAMSLFIAATVHDVTPARERRTMLLAILPAFAATALAILLRPVPVAADAALVLILAAAVHAQSYPPRWPPLGMVAVISFVVTLVLHPPIAELPLRLSVLVIAVLVTMAMRFVLWPERPAATVRRIGRAIRRQISALLGAIEVAVRSGEWPAGSRRYLHHGVIRLNEAAMLVSAKLDQHARDHGAALHLIELELATDRVVWVATHHMPAPTERGAVAAHLAALRRMLAGEAIPLGAVLMGSPLDSCLASLVRILADAPTAEKATLAAAVPPPSQRPAPLRYAVQAGVAVALAVFGGHLISESRWYWAAFAAFIVFQGTHSRGESFAKGLRFVLGTGAGVIGGVLLGTALAGRPDLLLGGVILAVFLAFNASTAAYTVMVFWITIILALLFSLVGYFSAELLLTRLEEATFGVVCGVVVAGALRSVRTGDVVAEAERGYLQALFILIDTATRNLIGGHPAPALTEAILTLEARSEALRGAVGSGLSLIPSHDRPHRRMRLLTACDFWVRELGRLGGEVSRRTDPDLAELIRCAVARIERTIQGLCGTLGPSSGSGDASDTAIEQAAGAQVALASPHADEESVLAMHLLLRIDAALLHLARERA